MDLTLHSVPSKDFFSLIRPRISFIVSKRCSRVGLEGVGLVIIHQGSASCPLKEVKKTKGLVYFNWLRNCLAKGLLGERWQNQLWSLAFSLSKSNIKLVDMLLCQKCPPLSLMLEYLLLDTFPSLPGRRGGFALSSVFLQHIVHTSSGMCYRVLDIFCLWPGSLVRRGLFLGKGGGLTYSRSLTTQF